MPSDRNKEATYYILVHMLNASEINRVATITLVKVLNAINVPHQKFLIN